MKRWTSCFGWLLTTSILAGPLWLGPLLISPPIAQAYKARSDVSIDYKQGETYATLLLRAETAARVAVQRSFDQDVVATAALVFVIVEVNGMSIPILSIDVSRSDWRSRPDSRYWANYLRSARPLLEQAAGSDGLAKPPSSPTITPPMPAAPTKPTAPAP